MPKPQVHAALVPTVDQQADLLRRAKAAWAATGEAGTPIGASGYQDHAGLAYVVLMGRGGITLAVYRVRPDNLMLRRMKRWPVEMAPKQAP